MACGIITQPCTKSTCPAATGTGGVTIAMGGVSNMAGGFSGSSARAVRRRPRTPVCAGLLDQVGGGMDSWQRWLRVPPAATEHRAEVLEVAAGKTIGPRRPRGKALDKRPVTGQGGEADGQGAIDRRAPAGGGRFPISPLQGFQGPQGSPRVEAGRLVIAGRQALIAQLQALLRRR